ncbi:unnamed protein product [Calypogeia fissa]
MDPQRLADQINMAPTEIARRLNIDPNQAEPVLKTTRDWVMMIGAALYVLSPLDLIPEAVFGVFGFLDDAVVILIAGIWYFRKYQATQASNKKRWTNKFKR